MASDEPSLWDVVGLLKALTEKVGSLSAKFDSLARSMEAMGAKQTNSALTRDETLVVVPRTRDGAKPTDQGLAYPHTLSELLVAGNESLPGKSERNTWSRGKSRALLAFYGEDLSDSEDEVDAELGIRARAKRLRVARVLGITQAQLNYAQLTL